MRDGPALLQSLLDGGSEAKSGVVATDLLGAFFQGYPVRNLLHLLHSEVPEQIRTGAWLLSELGNRASELRNELPTLLRHSDPYVRFNAIDSALSCCTAADGDMLASVVRLLEDSHQGGQVQGSRLSDAG
jgi:hypothetical protein